MNDKAPQGSQEPIDKTLAVLVNEYLKKHNYSSTSATFCAEAHVVKPTEPTDQQGSFLSDWFRYMYSFLQASKSTPVNESEIKRFIESSRQLFELHKIPSVVSSLSNNGPQTSLAGTPSSAKSEGFSSKFGGPNNQDSGEPPSKIHAGSNPNGKTPTASTPGSKYPHATTPGSANGMASSMGQGNFTQGGAHQLRPQFSLSLPSHSAGTLANWPGAQGMSMPGNAMSNPMQQSGDGTSQQMMPYGMNGHMANGSVPPNALQASSFDPNMTALLNGSPAGLKGSMPQQQQFMSPQQQHLLAQQQSNQQRYMLNQQNQRYLMQQHLMAGGLVNPQMAYMNPNPVVAGGVNNNRMIPMYQQREVYAQHHKQVQLLKLQQHTARQQLMANQRGGNLGQNMGQALGRPGENPAAHMGALGYPGNHALTHPGGAQNPLLIQQMMNMGAMNNFNGTSSAQHPMANGMPNMASNLNMTPNQNSGLQSSASNPSQSAPGTVSTPTNGNGASANVNFEALFASMHSSGVNMNGSIANMGSMANAQSIGSSAVSNGADQSKTTNQEEDNSKIFGKFIDSDIFSMNDNSVNANSQGVGASGTQLGDQSANLDIFTLDPFSHSEFFS